MDSLLDLARYQVWADAQHWKTLQAVEDLREDREIRDRLSHMVFTCEMLQMLARGETPTGGAWAGPESLAELEAAMTKAHEGLAAALNSLDLAQMIQLPRGPNGPFQAPVGVLLLQAILHSQHHRGQNAGRMRELGVAPPMTDYIIWHALGRP
jgi:uncharacterized damage-inducible protein DinB